MANGWLYGNVKKNGSPAANKTFYLNSVPTTTNSSGNYNAYLQCASYSPAMDGHNGSPDPIVLNVPFKNQNIDFNY